MLDIPSYSTTYKDTFKFGFFADFCEKLSLKLNFYRNQLSSLYEIMIDKN